MDRVLLKVSVRGQLITRTESIEVKSGIRNHLSIKFSFDKSWEGLISYALFGFEDTVYKEDIVDGMCNVPWQCTENEGTFSVSLFGGNLITTNMLKIQVSKSGYTSDVIAPDDEERKDLFQQLMHEIATRGVPEGGVVGQVLTKTSDGFGWKNNIGGSGGGGGSTGGGVESVNNVFPDMFGNVEIKAEDIGAIPDTVVIPTKISELENDSDFVIDDNYVRTDNNFTNEHKQQISQNILDIETLDSTKADRAEIPTNISELTNDLSFISEIPAEYVTKEIMSKYAQPLGDYIDVDGMAIEVQSRIASDTELQRQIDVMNAKSDVVDIVGSYASLLEYDTSLLGLNDIIKVINDETNSNSKAYYRYTENSTWKLIGKEASGSGGGTTITTGGVVQDSFETNTKASVSDLGMVAFNDNYNDLKNKPTSLPASDVYSWAKQPTKPTYTSSEVGLNHVPNVTTNNQTPTWTIASTFTSLVSGETLTVAFGKIALAVQNIIDHILDLNNPHAVTKKQIGLQNVDNTSDSDKPLSTAQKEYVDSVVGDIEKIIDSINGEVV